MKKRMILMLAVVALIFGAFYGFQTFKATMIKQALASLRDPPQTVATAVATLTPWQSSIKAVGSVRAEAGADLALESSGTVAEINFKSGDEVAEGQVLLKLRDDQEVASLDALKATADVSSLILNRDREQLKIHAVSQATIDSDTANLKKALAEVAEQQAVVDKKTLKAPFAGRLGIRSVDLGQYVSAGTTIVTLQSLNPIFVDFYLPQQALAEVRTGQTVKATVDTYPGQAFEGTVTAISPKVDVASRNVQVRAEFKNDDHRLTPGMFATVEISVGTPDQLVTLPQTAVTANPYGDIVFVVEKKEGSATGLTARQVFVTTGATRGDQIAITDGIKAGEQIVVAGQMKLHNGSQVSVNNAVLPTDDPSPTIVDR
ncbi:membrane fusion protein, multidrug efflux system [Pseudoxanthobacter soli DSM 19599]|uniref:Membrane fusion protein, multidrug efflux system n=1 Tax=Pseudoxanthobacter soli DSM 19599 TaxID=1123029 RepID=A0A1M7ZRJ9_9HYPH|nr:efflux RND transporter periplasmic adaptor subunit [Pseudoxanthobacter soli]SHO67538.1 membrane fusion protein, multidrug efflux system [Pseudoxanthobacter soli DSM 19599]